MFSVGDYVQPRQGGPKLKVLEVNGEEIVATRRTLPATPNPVILASAKINDRAARSARIRR
jgi:hypothetical protein